MTKTTSARPYLVLALTFVLVFLLSVPSGFAARGGGGGKPGGGGGGSVTLVMVEDANGNGSPNWNDTVSFDVSTTATDSPELKLTCSQGGAVVYRTQTAYYDGYPFWWTQQMRLESGMWTGGAADCTAVLFYTSGRKTPTLATLDFHVEA